MNTINNTLHLSCRKISKINIGDHNVKISILIPTSCDSFEKIDNQKIRKSLWGIYLINFPVMSRSKSSVKIKPVVGK